MQLCDDPPSAAWIRAQYKMGALTCLHILTSGATVETEGRADGGQQEEAAEWESCRELACSLLALVA